MEPATLEQRNLHSDEYFARFYSDRDWNFYRPLLAEIVRYAPPGKIVDAGCGLGFFVECARRFNFDAEGIEGSPFAVEQARARGLTVHERMLSEPLPYETGTIAAIVANQVIEHVPNDVAGSFMREAYRALQPSGILVIKSPSKYNLEERKEPTHINMYATSRLLQDVESCGFVIINKNNVLRDFGFGRIGRLSALLIRRFLSSDYLYSTANCIARKP